MRSVSNRGENPFEAYIKSGRAHPIAKATPRPAHVVARMEAARIQGEKQRDLGLRQHEPKAALPLALPELAKAPLAFEPQPPEHHIPSGRQVWISMWLGIWVVLTIIMMFGNFLGALIVSIPLFFVCIFLAQAPQLYAGTFADGRGRANNGTAV